MLRDVVEDQVVALITAGEVLLRVVDDVVCADRSDQVHLRRAAHAGHFCAERLGDLHRERADASPRAVDQDLLAGLDLALIAKTPQGGEPGQRNCCGLLERDAGWLGHQILFLSNRILRESTGARAEDLFPYLEPRHVPTDRLDGPGHIRAPYTVVWLAKPELCAAISNAGGLGNLTAGNYDSKEEFRLAIKETRRLTDNPFCVNITFMPSVRITADLLRDYFDACCEEGVTALEISGTPIDRQLGPEAVAKAKASDIKLIHKLGSVRHARHAESVGYDAVIAAGIEEGGHPLNDDVTTMVLTPRISETVGIPVITAGGIADGRGLAAALVLGGEGVMMASRFIATKDCLANDLIKEELTHRQEYETTLICKTLGLQMRCLKNVIAQQVLDVEAGHFRGRASVHGR